HAVEQRLERRMRHRLELVRHLRRTLGVLLVDPGEFGPGHPPQQARVVVTQRARADHPHADGGSAHTMTPRCDASMNLRKVSTSGACGSSARARAMPWLTVRSELNSRR